MDGSERNVEALRADLAQVVLEQLSPDLPYPVNLMGADGRILASADPDRVGELHPAAERVLRTRSAVDVLADDDRQRAGINLPIRVHDRIVGVVGVTGPPSLVRPVAHLVASTVALLIEQRRRAEAELRATRSRDRLLERIVGWVGPYPSDLIEAAAAIDLALPPRGELALVVSVETELAELAERPGSLWPAAPALLLRGSGSIGEAATSVGEPQVDEVLAAVRRLDPTARLVLAPARATVAESLQLARHAACVVAELELDGAVHHYDDLAVLCQLLAGATPKDPLAKLVSHADLLRTVKVVVRCRGDLQASAARLHVHRNTLGYRLDRVQALTGLNPRDPIDLIVLLAALLRRAWALRAGAQPIPDV